jgi:hypothetical protein
MLVEKDDIGACIEPSEIQEWRVNMGLFRALIFMLVDFNVEAFLPIGR